MSYQVLARKWRPRTFQELAGQEHVLQALVNALNQNRLHHAYLFTGTRGVGKTTIARILAKCLNCESGVSAEPCQACSACTEIDEGRFVDLIEVDAASRTKVEDTRELLENVQYAPTRGRYKVYLIDEVHMLSINSFNALLKTLEEPPPHVKFLLATTDPQKLPVTILSRCLQFNLKNLHAELITKHLQDILGKESIEFDDSALWQLARAADGSMRDALSLTDQAIAFGNGKLCEADVRNMLGSIDHKLIYRLVDCLIEQDGQQLLQVIDELTEHNPDYSGALQDLLALLHRISIAQAVPDAVSNAFGDREQVIELATRLSAEDSQLFYQLGINGQRDMPYAPDPRSGFEMVLLRMLSFRPVAKVPATSSGSAPTDSDNKDETKENATATPVTEVELADEKKPDKPSEPELAPASPPVEPETPATRPPAAKQADNATVEQTSSIVAVSLDHLSADTWYNTFNNLPVSGVVQNTAAHCVLDAVHQEKDSTELHFTLDDSQSSLFNPSHQERLSLALTNYFGKTVNATISVGTPARETPAAIKQRLHDERQQQAQDAFLADQNVQGIVDYFDGQVLLHTIKPVDH